MAPGDRPTRSIGERLASRGDRGQTLVDYSAGISIFLLVVAFSLTFVPSFATPFEAPIQSDQTAQADRVALGTLQNLTAANEGSVANSTRVDEFFGSGTYPADGDDLRSMYRLPEYVRVNVTLQTVEGVPDESVGDPYGDHAVAASARILADDDQAPDRCRPTCRLIVRVW